MFGKLPVSLLVGRKELPINSDYRNIIRIFDAFSDIDAEDNEKFRFMVETLYQHPDDITDYDEAIEKALWFLNCGKEPNEHHVNSKKVYDWNQDEQMIFSAVNKVSGKELREIEYLHYWTFMGYFQEVEEGLLTHVINIRDKKNKGQKLTKEEQNFYIKNKELIDLKRRYTKEELETLEAVNKILGIGGEQSGQKQDTMVKSE